MLIMLSGALLLGKQESYRAFLGKRLRRFAVPAAAWICIYLVWKKILWQPDMNFQEAFRQAVNGQVQYHFWFIYTLAGIYLAAPLIKVLVRHAAKKDLVYYFVLWAVFSCLIATAEKWDELRAPHVYHWRISPFIVNLYGGFFILGYVFRYRAPLPSLKRVLPGLICAGAFHGFFYFEFAPNTAIYLICAYFALIHAANFIEKNGPKILISAVKNLSKASFGIYLVHPIVLDAITMGRFGFRFDGTSEPPFLMIPVTALTVYALSFALIILLQKIPLLKRIT